MLVDVKARNLTARNVSHFVDREVERMLKDLKHMRKMRCLLEKKCTCGDNIFSLIDGNSVPTLPLFTSQQQQHTHMYIYNIRSYEKVTTKTIMYKLQHRATLEIYSALKKFEIITRRKAELMAEVIIEEVDILQRINKLVHSIQMLESDPSDEILDAMSNRIYDSCITKVVKQYIHEWDKGFSFHYTTHPNEPLPCKICSAIL